MNQQTNSKNRECTGAKLVLLVANSETWFRTNEEYWAAPPSTYQMNDCFTLKKCNISNNLVRDCIWYRTLTLEASRIRSSLHHYRYALFQSPLACYYFYCCCCCFFSHCSFVHALIWSACISSNNPCSFKLFCISRWRLRSGTFSKVGLTTVNSSLAPHPSEWSMMLHAIALGYCFCTWILKWVLGSRGESDRRS